MVEAIIDTHLRASISFHDVFHGFHTGRGMGTVILELKLAWELSRVNQDPLFLVFMDLRNSYNTVERGSLLTALEEYCAGPNMCRLL